VPDNSAAHHRIVRFQHRSSDLSTDREIYAQSLGKRSLLMYVICANPQICTSYDFNNHSKFLEGILLTTGLIEWARVNLPLGHWFNVSTIFSRGLKVSSHKTSCFFLLTAAFVFRTAPPFWVMPSNEGFSCVPLREGRRGQGREGVMKRESDNRPGRCLHKWRT